MTLASNVLFTGFGVPESLRWHDGALWFCDLVEDGWVYRVTPSGELERVVQVPGRPAGLGWLPDGRMLVVSMDEHRVYRREEDGTLVRHADLSGFAAGDANDMLVDDRGRAYVGNFGFDYHGAVKTQANAMLYAPPGPPRAPLAAFTPDGSLIGLSDGLYFPNGAVLLDGGRTLVVAETMAMRLTAFTVDTTGRLVDPRVWASLIPRALWWGLNHPGRIGSLVRGVSALMDRPAIAARSSSPIAPDGICVHSDGQTIWAANALRGECVRVHEGGSIVERVKTTQRTLSCVVGGPDVRTLYVSTVPVLDPEEARAAARGCIESVRLPA
jgi:sugar lactone lactonase YvrE